MIRIPALVLIMLWRRCVSPWLPSVCRFYPSCSVYAWEAINSKGLTRGSLLSLRRIVRCHPFHPGGVDLPPGWEA
ncbi:MAG: membrane protein insertion efficiency factor YidD [Nitrospinae bacterium]|nr:membrane protein insertion efficiency factor YidD [Nitrospinota bacterium]